MDWRFVEDEKWKVVHDALNGEGVESMQAKWDEMFREKEEEVLEEVKVKKPRKKAVVKKKPSPVKNIANTKKQISVTKKPAKKKAPPKKSVKATVKKPPVKKPVTKKSK